ncbi:MAG: GxxExxY protein [Chitinophagaceae bacterium]|nr:GxxExxY protein [Chitinophagaceae bacterium]
MELDDLTYKIRGAFFEVHKELGPGLLESVYEMALMREFELQGLKAKSQVVLPVSYKDAFLELGFRLDIIVEHKVIIEIKSVKAIEDVHKKQLLTYLKLSELKIGFLVNFNSTHLKDRESIFRIVNNL